ncbi:MAG TPA: YggT family protein [Nocardioides sp.]|uniref:YggT family protein n=1 Tax=Nocardioides sp. TaxID=35761 RepID=UPI002BE8FADB|nr:YggT family protein [Nocardioides sp.]HQR25800.1 YggT family protein [Nocardioides sp.]
MVIVGWILEIVLWSFMALLWVRFVAGWVQAFARSWSPHGPLLVLLEITYTVTDPPIKALRRVIPPLRIGGVAIDLSSMLVLLGAWLLLMVNRMIFAL